MAIRIEKVSDSFRLVWTNPNQARGMMEVRVMNDLVEVATETITSQQYNVNNAGYVENIENDLIGRAKALVNIHKNQAMELAKCVNIPTNVETEANK